MENKNIIIENLLTTQELTFTGFSNNNSSLLPKFCAIMKKIPYGMTDFERIRKEDYYYVDKTRYIEEVERAGSYIFLMRPRRFGKSLFMDVLYDYYDINRADQFDEIYGGTYTL